ncbi:MAG: HD domain-containing protein [Clostridia bacterium]|nr:HD domain-containing protein [Clostridia bacterium]
MNLVNVLNMAMFILSSIILIVYVYRFKDNTSRFYMLLFIFSMIYTYGCHRVTMAQSLEAAELANIVTYFGSCFAPFFMFLCIADICKVRVYKIFHYIYFSISILLFILISFNFNGLYYKETSFEVIDGVGTLHKVSGALHIFYPLYLGCILVSCIVIIIRSFLKQKGVSYKYSISLVALLAVVVTTYLVGPSVMKFDLVPMAYVFSELVILILLNRITYYNVHVVSSASVNGNNKNGFFVVDNNGLFLGSDDVANEWFPELESLHIDSKIKEENSELLKAVGAFVRGEEKRDAVVLKVKSSYYELEDDLVKISGKKQVHCFCVRDDTKQQEYTHIIEQYNGNLEKAVEEKTKKIKTITEDIIRSMATIVENRDNNTGGHIARTSDVVRIFVRYLVTNTSNFEFDMELAKNIIKAAPLHDFGKIAIPDVVLNKPGRFTDEEYEIMKRHSEKGAAIVEKILASSEDKQFIKIAVNIAHYHHEKWNGQGYPTGISGTDIPFEARIMALADVFDALVSKRVYKESMDFDKAFSIIEESSGTHFDPDLCKEFLNCRDELIELYNSYDD